MNPSMYTSIAFKPPKFRKHAQNVISVLFSISLWKWLKNIRWPCIVHRSSFRWSDRISMNQIFRNANALFPISIMMIKFEVADWYWIPFRAIDEWAFWWYFSNAGMRNLNGNMTFGFVEMQMWVQRQKPHYNWWIQSTEIESVWEW